MTHAFQYYVIYCSFSLKIYSYKVKHNSLNDWPWCRKLCAKVQFRYWLWIISCDERNRSNLLNSSIPYFLSFYLNKFRLRLPTGQGKALNFYQSKLFFHLRLGLGFIPQNRESFLVCKIINDNFERYPSINIIITQIYFINIIIVELEEVALERKSL